MTFIKKDVVRMHDTDMAGILYFPRVFRFVHDALEDYMAGEEHLTFHQILKHEPFLFVIAHAEADYQSPLTVGDKISVFVDVIKIGETSYTMAYEIKKEDGTLACTAKTVHVTIDRATRKKIPIPAVFRKGLEKHLRK